MVGLSLGLSFPGRARADLLEDVLAAKLLRCGVYADVPPFSAPDPVSRRLAGMDVDLCTAVATRLGVSVQLVPLSVESRIPELQMGRIDIVIANLAYTRTRAMQIDYSYAYYIGREELVVWAADAARQPADFRGRRLSAAKASTSEQSIRINGGVAVTYQDTGAAYLALQQHKVSGLVTNSITAHQLISRVAAAGIHLALLEQPMALEPVAIGLRKGEPALLAKVNEVLRRMEQQGQIDAIWSRWLGPGTAYNIPRRGTVIDVARIDFQPLP